MALLRASVLRYPRPEGGLDLLDLLLDTLHSLSAEEARLLADLERHDREGREPETDAQRALAAKLEEALLWEGPVAEQLRQQRHAARVHRWSEGGQAEEAPSWSPPPGPLPELLAPAWRDPERYRRLREERLAGRELFVLRGLIDPSRALALAEEASALPFERLVTSHVEAERCTLNAHLTPPQPLQPLWALLRDPMFRLVIGAVLGRPLGEALLLNAWRLRPGDRMAVHPDGPRYLATFSLGLCPDWTAAQGGAIAFGDPRPPDPSAGTPGGLEVRERFQPHLGDACLFVPHAGSWHAVERVRSGERLSVTGWWLPTP